MDKSKIFICDDFYYGDSTMEKGRKIYYSFHDLPQRTYEAPYTHEYPISKGFSKTELTHLLIAMGTLTIAFSFAFAEGVGGIINGVDLYSVLQVIPLSFFGILTAFFFHELAHRFVARKYNLWAEFRMYPQGLLFALIFGVLFGFVFAIPGAVHIRGQADGIKMGRIAAAGPLTNILIATITFPLYMIFSESFIGTIFGFMCFVNVFLGVFNLIPFGPLDGKKILRWNAIAWAFLLIIGAIIFSLIWPRMPAIIT